MCPMREHVFRPEAYKEYLGLPGRRGREQIRAEIAAGTLLQPSYNWLAHPDAPRDLITAANHNVLIGCLSACKIHDVWTPPHHQLHAIYSQGQRKDPVPGIVFHRSLNPKSYVGEHLTAGSSQTIVSPLIDALEHVVRYHDTETALVVLESALYKKKTDETTIFEIIARAGHDTRKLLNKASWQSQSGSESRIKAFLHSRRYPFQQQATIRSIGNVDFLVGRSLIIECDSVTYHSAREQMNIDRMRDLNARQLGYDVARFSYDQIWNAWEETQEALATILNTKNHLKAPQPLPDAVLNWRTQWPSPMPLDVSSFYTSR